eukprot:3666093-Rhodomonas_salina.1
MPFFNSGGCSNNFSSCKNELSAHFPPTCPRSAAHVPAPRNQTQYSGLYGLCGVLPLIPRALFGTASSS